MGSLAATGVEVVESVRSFFQKVSLVFVELWYWPIIFLGLMVLSIVVMSFLVKFSYENRILKSVNKLNKYFLSKPFITEENLVEFNLKMKKIPKVLRTNWQIYMLNREDSPTKYINVNSCIDKPLRTSSIEKNMSNFTVFTIFLAFFSFVVGLQYANILGQNTVYEVLFTACLIPLILIIVYTVFILVIRATKNDIYACLYENFPLYERNLTKATSTLPSYVDYEVLFTKKEIKEGIPILQQYLEKRALIEQQELEKARESSVAVEEYDFSDLGVDGSLVLERAMKESETFIRSRNRLQDESNSIELEKENYKKTFESNLKDMQRKLQASRENMESLKAQQEASTNRIESNYIRKQQADEIKKQQELEKNIEEATTKFNEEQVSLQQEIEKREKEIEDKKQFVQNAMMLEFKHYANTLYKALTDKAVEVANQKLLALSQENSDLKTLLTDIQGVGSNENNLENQNAVIQNDEITAENIYDLENKNNNSEQQVYEVEGQNNEQNFNNQFVNNYVQQQPTFENVQQSDNQQINNLQDEQFQVDNQQIVGDTQNNLSNKDKEQEVQQEQEIQESNAKHSTHIEQNQVGEQDDINEIQKQIEEENSKLMKEKQEFENNINDTISKMDNKNLNQNSDIEENDDAQNIVPEEKESVENVVEEPIVEQVIESDEQDEENEYEQEPAPRPRRSVRRTSSEDSEPRARRGRSVRKSSRSASKATSEIDSLNAEMQKLLDSTKK